MERTEISGCGSDLIEGFALVDRLMAKLTTAVGEFDRGGEWELDGWTSAVAWLRTKARLSGGEAKSMLCTARRLRSLPVTSTAWECGELSRAQVGAINANLKDSTVELFARHEAQVIPTLSQCSVTETAAVMRRWAAMADALADDPEDPDPERSLHISATFNGRSELSASLDPESGEIVGAAIALACTKDVEGEPTRCPATRRADALTDICRLYLTRPVDRDRSSKAPTSMPPASAGCCVTPGCTG